MKLVVGLGNPGPEYRQTRHNVGFLALEAFARTNGFADFEDAPKFKGLLATGTVNGGKVLLLKPLTYMNLSGDSVAPILAFYKLDPTKDLLVLSDDADMEFGKVRFREKGSSGGQNGLKSVIERLGTDAFARIKIGIGRDPRFDTADWVLSKFKKEEFESLETAVFSKIRESITEFLSR